MIKSYKIRLYPTKEQEQLMWKHVGSCRFIWNWMLAKQEELYKQGEKHLSGFDMINLLSPMKKQEEYKWMREVSNISLCTICRDLDKAYKMFFKKTSGFPKFKSRKKSKPNFPIRTDTLYFKDDKVLNIEKIGKVMYKTDFVFEYGRNACKFTNARVSYINGKWILSFGMECENQTRELNDISMGIDLGVKDLAIVEYNGEPLVFHNINKSKQMRNIGKRLKHLQRSISRKYEANRDGKKYNKTKNIERQEERLRKLYARQSNIRRNYIHQTTHKLVSLLPKRIVMEDLNVQGVMKNRHLSKAVQEQCFYEFIRQMEYKCAWNGIEFIKADRFYPSSKTCSSCGCIKKDLKLSDRTYHCDDCGLVIDRDYNAAINLSRYVA
ncbi:MAG: transposase [Clostridia bacterium]|nr:transposase [Clostridia bacterium]